MTFLDILYDIFIATVEKWDKLSMKYKIMVYALGTTILILAYMYYL